MKSQISLFVLVGALLATSPVAAATNTGMRAASSADLSGMPAERARENVNYEKYETRTTTTTMYDVKDGDTMYYTTPANRSQLYKQYSNTPNNGQSARTVRTNRAETYRTEVKRKYYLAHPFFQPLKGKFGSVTDFSYNMNSYNFKINQTEEVDGGLWLNGISGKWDMQQFAIKEDFSYGITDRIAIMGMLRYDTSKYKFKWDDPEFTDDKMSDSGLNLFGLGARWRFVDDSKWIATASAYFQHQKDMANMYILDLMAGYKVSSSTIYGLVRGWAVDFDGNSYGNGVSDDNALMYIAYDTDISTEFYFEGGVGVFSVLDEDWTLNLEAIFGHYGWNNQASIKGAIGWQPNDWFALNLYAKTSFYDSADDKDLNLYWMEPAVGLDSLTYIGTTKLDKYSEWSVGLQAIFYF